MSNTITLPQTLIKRLEYEEWFAGQVEAGMADEKAGRVYGKEEFWAQLDKAGHGRKKAA